MQAKNKLPNRVDPYKWKTCLIIITYDIICLIPSIIQQTRTARVRIRRTIFSIPRLFISDSVVNKSKKDETSPCPASLYTRYFYVCIYYTTMYLLLLVLLGPRYLIPKNRPDQYTGWLIFILLLELEWGRYVINKRLKYYKPLYHICNRKSKKCMA
jgi:hypothetical protein